MVEQTPAPVARATIARGGLMTDAPMTSGLDVEAAQLDAQPSAVQALWPDPDDDGCNRRPDLSPGPPRDLNALIASAEGGPRATRLVDRRKEQAVERLAPGQGLGWRRRDLHERCHHPALSDALAEAGLPIIRLHDARHTAASQWLAAGVPLEDVSGCWATPLSRTADTHGHVQDDSRQAAARAMAARLEGGHALSEQVVYALPELGVLERRCQARVTLPYMSTLRMSRCSRFTINIGIQTNSQRPRVMSVRNRCRP